MHLAYLVIWQNGVDRLYEIMSVIEKDSALQPTLVAPVAFRTHKQLINEVYADDYSPKHHLNTKLKYLSRFSSRCYLIICVTHQQPEYTFVGQGATRHIEDLYLNSVKNKIREKFNAKDKNGEISHNHVLHAFDNQLAGYTFAQKFISNHIQKCLMRHSFIDVTRKPVELDVSELKCRNFDKSGRVIDISIESSQQYNFLVNRDNTYKEYIATHLGGNIKYWHSEKRYLNLMEQIVSGDNEIDPIVVNSSGLILDGLHRAAISLFMKRTKIKGYVIDD